MSQVVVDEPRIEHSADRTVVQVDVTVGTSPARTVEYVLPPVGVHRRQVIDAMFVIGRLVAMRKGWELVLPGPVSARLLDRAEIFQDVFLEWFTERAHAMPLDFEAAEPLDLPPDRGVLCTFSGGVDSYHSVLENQERLSALLFIHGLDIGLEQTDFRERVSRELNAAAADLGLPLWEVSTNIRGLTNHYAGWGRRAHGSVLASVAILLAQEVDTFLVPGTVTRGAMNGEGWGSHVVTDRLSSTDYLSIEHDGADVPRPLKTARIARSESALRHLRVCYSSKTLYNCGQCRKCRRTLIDLDLAGVTDPTGIFGDAETLEVALANLEVNSTVTRALGEATRVHARALGRRDVAVPMSWAIRRYDAEVLKSDASRLRGVLRKDHEFRAMFPRPRRPARPKVVAPPAPTLRALLSHWLERRPRPESSRRPLAWAPRARL